MKENHLTYLRGIGYALLYYAVAVVLMLTGSDSGHPPLSWYYGIVFLIGAGVWVVVDLLRMGRMRARGSLTVHAIVAGLLTVIYLRSLAG